MRTRGFFVSNRKGHSNARVTFAHLGLRQPAAAFRSQPAGTVFARSRLRDESGSRLPQSMNHSISSVTVENRRHGDWLAERLFPFSSVSPFLLAPHIRHGFTLGVRLGGRGRRNPLTKRLASTATMPPNRPKGRGGGGACPSCLPRVSAKGRCGRLRATFELPVHRKDASLCLLPRNRRFFGSFRSLWHCARRVA